MEEIHDSVTRVPSDRPKYTFSFDSERARKELERIRQQEVERDRKRREGRIKGEISHSLGQKLHRCNILQLKKVIKICKRRVRTLKEPPTEDECRLSVSYVVSVLCSITIRNKRFMIELRRNSARAKKLYVNGPYVRAYWRDGEYLGKQNYAKDKLRHLPRKVQRALRELSRDPAVEEFRLRLQEKLSSVNE
jgi:hypothetical protein